MMTGCDAVHCVVCCCQPRLVCCYPYLNTLNVLCEKTACTLLYIVLSAVVFQFDFTAYTIVHASDISVWYQFPQYIVITAGEVLFAVTGLSFAYSQVIYRKILLIS